MQKYLLTGSFGFLFVLPLLSHVGNGASPWELPKLIFLIFGILSLVLIFLFQKLKSEILEFRYNKFLIISSAFVASSFISYFMSDNLYLSFWGDKLLPSDSMLCLLLCLMFSALFLQLNVSLNRISLLFVSILTCQVVIGLIQIFNLNFSWWGFHYLIFGTQGQPVAYATLIGCLSPFLCLAYFRKENNLAQTTAAGVLLFFLNFTMLHVGSRTPLAVFWLTLAGIVTFFLFYRKHFNAVKKIVGFSLIILGSTLIFKMQKDVAEIEIKLSPSQIKKGVETRRLVLESGIEAWKQKPLFGYGPQMFISAERPYQTSEFNLYEYWENGWIKAHNHLLDLAVNQGISGLTITLILYGLLLISSVRLIVKRKTSASDLFTLASFAGFNFLFLANLTAFNMLTTQLLFTLFPILVSISLNDIQTVTLKLRSSIRAFFLVISAIAIGLFLVNSYNYWKADILAQSWLRSEKLKSDSLKSLELSYKASDLNPSEPDYYCLIGRLYTEMLVRNYKSMKSEDVNKSLEAIDENMNRCVLLGSGMVYYLQLTAEVYEELYIKNVLSSPEKALNQISEVQKIIPYNPKPWLELGRIYLHSGQDQKFIETAKKAISLKADYVPAYIELLQFLYQQKNLDEVMKLTDIFNKAEFLSAEFVPYIPDLITIANQNNDQKSKVIFQNAYDKFKNLIPVTKSN